MPIREFACDSCSTITERIFLPGENEQSLIECECGETAYKVWSVPTVHTIETHLRGIKDPGLSSDSGGYWDQNIVDGKGNPTYVRSLSHKRELLKEHGMDVKEASDGAKDRLRAARRISVSG